MIELLDKFPNEEVLKVLDYFYGYDDPIWEECSEEEYNQGQSEQRKHLDNIFSDPNIKLPSLEEIEDWFTDKQFKKEPVYKEWKGGILNLIKLQDEKEPDYYKYYKKAGTKRIILVGSQIIDYLNKRGIKWQD